MDLAPSASRPMCFAGCSAPSKPTTRSHTGLPDTDWVAPVSVAWESGAPVRSAGVAGARWAGPARYRFTSRLVEQAKSLPATTRLEWRCGATGESDGAAWPPAGCSPVFSRPAVPLGCCGFWRRRRLAASGTAAAATPADRARAGDSAGRGPRRSCVRLSVRFSTQTFGAQWARVCVNLGDRVG